MRFRLVFFIALAILGTSCKPEFTAIADAEEIRVVVGVLNPEDTVQYVRVSKGFLLEGDAIAFAGEADLTWPGQQVILSGSNGQTVTGFPVTDIPREPGVFHPAQVLYKFRTDGSGPTSGKLLPGVRYQLEIGTPDSPEYVSAATTIPEVPFFRGTLLIQDGAGSLNCLPKFDLRYAQQISWLKVNAKAYEIRMRLRFQRTGVEDSIIWGPTPMIYGNAGCNDGNGRICYKFGARLLLNYLKARMPQQGVRYTYDTKDTCVVNPHNDPLIDATMPRSFEFEVTAIDTALANYMEVNQAGNLELTGAKPEYTNVGGKLRCVGVFGSINLDRRWATLSLCTENILGLNDRPILPDCQ
jgi:hypothetical protein